MVFEESQADWWSYLVTFNAGIRCLLLRMPAASLSDKLQHGFRARPGLAAAELHILRPAAAPGAPVARADTTTSSPSTTSKGAGGKQTIEITAVAR